MDAGTFRWVLIAIAAVLALAIYLFGLHQARARKQDVIENFSNDDMDEALVGDERLRDELIGLSTVAEENEFSGNLDEIQITPSSEAQEPDISLHNLDEMRIDPGIQDRSPPVTDGDLFDDEPTPLAEDDPPAAQDHYEIEPDPVELVDPEPADDDWEADEPESVLAEGPEPSSEYIDEDEMESAHEIEPWIGDSLEPEEEEQEKPEMEDVLHEALETAPENLDEDRMDYAEADEDDDEDTDLDLEEEEADSLVNAETIEDPHADETEQGIHVGAALREGVYKDDKLSAGNRIKQWFRPAEQERFELPELADKNPERLVSYHLRHEDLRLIVGEEAESAAHHVGLELNPNGLLEYYEDDELVFQIASLSAPGNFFEIENLEFVTLGFNCFIDLDISSNPRQAYEIMLKKIDELVRLLGVMVYKPDDELLSINDVADMREKLA